jgi:hypothetical protein
VKPCRERASKLELTDSSDPERPLRASSNEEARYTNVSGLSLFRLVPESHTRPSCDPTCGFGNRIVVCEVGRDGITAKMYPAEAASDSSVVLAHARGDVSRQHDRRVVRLHG